MTIDIKVPVKWNDLTIKHIEYFSKMMLKKLTDTEIMTLCFLKFSGLKLIKKAILDKEGYQYIFKKKGFPRFIMDADQATTCIYKMDYLVQDVSLFELPARIKKYDAYDYRLYDVSLEQYLLLDSYFQAFIFNNDISYLNRMLAVMYHMPGEKWNVDLIAQWEKRFKRVPLFRKYIIFLWFSGLKKWIQEKYFYVFNSGDDTGSPSPDEIVLQLLSALNDGDITHNKEILATNVHEALFELNRKIEQSKNV
jgi:hypothetical protein